MKLSPKNLVIFSNQFSLSPKKSDPTLIEVAPNFTLGADVGYAIGINDGNDGGFYYSPRAPYSVSEAIDIVAAYRGVSVNGGSWDVISAGVEFGID